MAAAGSILQEDWTGKQQTQLRATTVCCSLTILFLIEYSWHVFFERKLSRQSISLFPYANGHGYFSSLQKLQSSSRKKSTLKKPAIASRLSTTTTKQLRFYTALAFTKGPSMSLSASNLWQKTEHRPQVSFRQTLSEQWIDCASNWQTNTTRMRSSTKWKLSYRDCHPLQIASTF